MSDEMGLQIRNKCERAYCAAVLGLAADQIRKLGFRLAPQYRVNHYRLDFAFISRDGRRVCVEIDGPEHSLEANRAADSRRDAWLRRYGWEVLRFGDGADMNSAARQTVCTLEATPIPTEAQILNWILASLEEVNEQNHHPAAVPVVIHRIWRDVTPPTDARLSLLRFAHAHDSSYPRNEFKPGELRWTCSCAWCQAPDAPRRLVTWLTHRAIDRSVSVLEDSIKGDWYVATLSFYGPHGLVTESQMLRTRAEAIARYREITGADPLCFCEPKHCAPCLIHSPSCAELVRDVSRTAL